MISNLSLYKPFILACLALFGTITARPATQETESVFSMREFRRATDDHSVVVFAYHLKEHEKLDHSSRYLWVKRVVDLLDDYCTMSPYAGTTRFVLANLDRRDDDGDLVFEELEIRYHIRGDGALLYFKNGVRMYKKTIYREDFQRADLRDFLIESGAQRTGHKLAHAVPAPVVKEVYYERPTVVKEVYCEEPVIYTPCYSCPQPHFGFGLSFDRDGGASPSFGFGIW
jgi:hypothetical protein